MRKRNLHRSRMPPTRDETAVRVSRHNFSEDSCEKTDYSKEALSKCSVYLAREELSRSKSLPFEVMWMVYTLIHLSLVRLFMKR